MSGGSLDYFYYKVEDVANTVMEWGKVDRNPHYIAFAIHLKLIADALHDIEWVISSDYAPGDETETIMKCLSKENILAATVQEGKDTLNMLQKMLDSINPSEESR